MKDINDSFKSKELFEQRERQRQDEIRRRAEKAINDPVQKSLLPLN